MQLPRSCCAMGVDLGRTQLQIRMRRRDHARCNSLPLPPKALQVACLTCGCGDVGWGSRKVTASCCKVRDVHGWFGWGLELLEHSSVSHGIIPAFFRHTPWPGCLAALRIFCCAFRGEFGARFLRECGGTLLRDKLTWQAFWEGRASQTSGAGVPLG